MSEPSRPYSSFDEILAAVRAATDQQPEPTTLIGIDGAGGSGKSTLSQNLATALGDTALIHLDDFADWSDDSNFQLSTFAERALKPLVAGITSKHQRYDWPTDTLGEWFEIPPKKIAIVEGVTALRPDLQEYWSIGIWVDCPREQRLERAIARDGEAARSKWVDSWMPGEDRYFAADTPWLSADFVFDGSGLARSRFNPSV